MRAALLAQAADALTYAIGLGTGSMVELNPVAVALGPGPALAAKATLIACLYLGRRLAYWRVVLLTALVFGVIGAASNVAAMT